MSHWNVHHLSDFLGSLGWYGYAAGALLVLLQTIFPFVPFVLVAGANVLVFGLWLGFLVNYVFSVLGATIAFLVFRYYGRAWAEKKLEPYGYIKKFNDKLERHGLLVIAISRIVPVFPSFAINLAAAVMKVRARDFIIGSMIGKAPMILLESLIGHDLLFIRHHKGRLLILVLVFVIMVMIGNHLKNKWIKGGTKV